MGAHSDGGTGGDEADGSAVMSMYALVQGTATVSQEKHPLATEFYYMVSDWLNWTFLY